MYSNLQDYRKEKDYLIAIDSDGCVFDNMTVKHQQYFFPLILDVFNIKDENGDYKKLWEKINLEYPSRGVNRFIGLGEFFKQAQTDLDITLYQEWLNNTAALKNELLETALEKTDDAMMKKALEWSKAVNSKIENELGIIEPFEHAVEAIKNCVDMADIVVVSSANHDAVIKEWEAANLLSHVKLVASQDVATKKTCLEKLKEAGYDEHKIIMIGDAIGDYYAAKSVGAHYYQITYQREANCWKAFNDIYRDEFYKNNYQYNGDDVLQIALQDALKVIKVNKDEYTDRFQHVSENGIYPKEENKLWTMSFYPGQLYLAYEMTGDATYLEHKEEILESFKERCDHGHMETHDIGFLFELTAYYDYKATGNEASKDLVIAAADKLMKRYRENGGYIQAWGPMESEETKTRIIIDCMMNLPLLHIASELTGDPTYKDAAISHAKVSSQTLLRKDATTYHTYWMDKKTGEPLYGATHQGHQDESTWARGQAWSLYGFYKSYEWTKDEAFLDAAKRSADVFIANLPQNDICYWDFDFTDENPDIRDSSAASTAAAGLLKLSQAVEPGLGEKYLEMGVTLLKRLANRYQNNEPYVGCGILKEGMYHRDHGARAYTSWGDYYYVEALSTFLKMKNTEK